MFLFLTVVQAIVAAALVAVVLMQRSEGGGLGIGGSPGGMMSARGAADLLSRTTKWLAVAFVGLSIALAAVAVDVNSGDAIESTLDRNVTANEADPLAVPSQQDGSDTAAPADPLAPSGE
ncbi:MAG: preprotein translocase subunit SecG [Erythrobacter sp.]|nr:preprotein translocase subunit SecG [Erythrobacter sp.]RZV34369.1 MAG: preprotein translocase subunit SecG [Sphingomonadaceae bacterium]